MKAVPLIVSFLQGSQLHKAHCHVQIGFVITLSVAFYLNLPYNYVSGNLNLTSMDISEIVAQNDHVILCNTTHGLSPKG
jgi:hypothetical protein